MFLVLFSIISSSLGALTNTYSGINAFVTSYGYIAIFVLMTLEYVSLPIPSEIVLPLIGLFAAKGTLSFFPALGVVVVAGIVGIFIDYYIAYFLGKDVVYAHAEKFHISKQRLDDFDVWFARNGKFAVFMARLIPVVRGLISLPAGFAKMKKSAFLLYSVAGSLIWDVVLMLFGYYGLASNNAYLVLTAIGVFGLAIYVVYKFAISRIKKKN
ncbi:MAG: DedA family protein [Candidatus Micrarchaeales archaeon]